MSFSIWKPKSPIFGILKSPRNSGFCDSSKTEERVLVYKSDGINSWLSDKKERNTKETTLLSEVTKFIDKNDVKNKKSQWGQIRSLCRQSTDSENLYELLFKQEHKKGFLRHGRGLEKWDNDIIKNLEEQKEELQDDYRKFVTLLSIYAPKEDDKRGE